MKLISHEGTIEIVGGNLDVPRQDLKGGTIFVEIPRSALKSAKEDIKIGVYSNDKLIETANTTFMGPVKMN